MYGNSRTEGNLEPNDSHEDEDDNNNNDTGPTTSTPIPNRKKRTNVSKPDELDEALIKALNQPVDEDTNVALSLVPSLQKLNAEEKLDTKIGILNIFKQITLARRFQTSSQSTSSYNVLQRRCLILYIIQGVTSCHHHNYLSIQIIRPVLPHHTVCLRFKIFKILHRQKILMIQFVPIFQMIRKYMTYEHCNNIIHIFLYYFSIYLILRF